MTFISLDVQKNYMILQKSTLEYQELVVQDNKQYAETQMANEQAVLTAKGTPMDTTSYAYMQYQIKDQAYDQQIASIESQLKTLNANIESFGKVIENNIKDECKLKLLG